MAAEHPEISCEDRVILMAAAWMSRGPRYLYGTERFSRFLPAWMIAHAHGWRTVIAFTFVFFGPSRAFSGALRRVISRPNRSGHSSG